MWSDVDGDIFIIEKGSNFSPTSILGKDYSIDWNAIVTYDVNIPSWFEEEYRVKLHIGYDFTIF